ncbi:hypothetical protein KFE25_009628 [Diacronema lutheri]|uniref:Cilia- and flagella-associated protein 58 central coiled coil domain-containing protein n=1 Tax=Diacronema lutheri TaxID=2081491 RepID=A0A8J5XYK9_DIALT|nr:hypothetical protein KFE25_009628 [Diacronema lutheri]
MAEAENFDTLGFDPAEFERLEADLESVLIELQGEPQLEPFKNEYETLFRALRKSHESERRLIKKCKELRVEVENYVQKVTQASKLSQEDQTAIANLRKEIERTWKAVDASHEKETRLRELIAQLKVELAALQSSARQESEHQGAKEIALRELVHKRDELVRERETVSAQISVSKGDIADAHEKLRVIEAERLAAEAAAQLLRTQVEGKRAEAEREARRKERLERELVELKARLEARNAEIKTKQQRLAEGAELVARLDATVREQKAHADRISKGYEVQQSRLASLELELAEQIRSNASLAQENKHRQAELRQKLDDAETAKAEARRLDKLIAAVGKKVRGFDDERVAAEVAREGVRAQVVELERQLELVSREVEGERKTHEDLVRERDILNKSLLTAVGSTQRCVDLVKITDSEKKNLEHEMAAYRADAHRARRQIQALERERAKYAAEALAASAKHREAVEGVARKEGDVLELQRRIAEGDAKLKQQQNLYEAVRADRNLYSKNLIESQEEIADMKRRFRTMSSQIDQLKDEIQSKDQHLTREHFEHMRVDKDRVQIRALVDEIKGKVGDAERSIAATKAEIAKLHAIVNDADAERAKQRKEYAIVLAERDVLGGQLIKRNNELQQLYEQIKLNQSMLRKGEAAYAFKLDDIGALKEQVYTLRAELSALRAAVAAVPDLKRDVVRLERDLLRERTKVRALQEELEHPLNVHRWRKLEGAEPTVYAMVVRIHSLQRRLIAKTDEVEAKDALIQQKEKLYVELKNILARQPGPEVAEQLTVYQTVLADKTKQLKGMNVELGAYRAQVGDLKTEAVGMSKQMRALKKEFFASQMRARKRHAGAEIDAALAELDRMHEQRLNAQLSTAGPTGAIAMSSRLGGGAASGGGSDAGVE